MKIYPQFWQLLRVPYTSFNFIYDDKNSIMCIKTKTISHTYSNLKLMFIIVDRNATELAFLRFICTTLVYIEGKIITVA